MDEYIIPDYLHARLKNWASWAKVRKFPSHCRSIEHRFRPEAGEVWEPAPVRISVDLLDAYDVERAWSRLQDKQKMALKAHYFLAPVAPKDGSSLKAVWGAFITRVSRALGIQRSGYSLAVYRAARLLEGELDGMARHRTIGQERG
jgi:hypothetical protein